jgi:hypothetical protein
MINRIESGTEIQKKKRRRIAVIRRPQQIVK